MAAGDDEPDMDAILTEGLRLARAIRANEDRNVEHRSGYEPEVTINDAVELAGAVIALDGLLHFGHPLPASWRTRLYPLDAEK